MSLAKQLDSLVLSRNDTELTKAIWTITQKYNVDNISRTEAYGQFYSHCRDIKWSFLASMVSRNAGWNMTDLYHPVFTSFLSVKTRQQILLTYERANWLIFRDAFPQLLLYYYWTVTKRNSLHLLDSFFVSTFMKKEWNTFFRHRVDNRLTYALITNEQHVIESTVLQHPLYKRNVFHSPLYHLQEWNHFTTVVFPTTDGHLYGASIKGFTRVKNRLTVGKQLYHLLFHRDLYHSFWEFHTRVPPTGSRKDYLAFCDWGERYTPPLRCLIPVIGHHVREEQDWTTVFSVPKYWNRDVAIAESASVTSLYRKKREELHVLASLHDWLTRDHSL